MKKERELVEKEIIRQVKREVDNQDYGEVWTLALALDRQDLERELDQLGGQEEGEIRARFLVKMEASDLVDGTDFLFYLRRRGEELEVQLDISYTETPADYQMIFGATVEDGLLWISQEANLIHLDLRDPKFASYEK